MALQEDLEKHGNWLFKYRGILPVIILFIGTGVYIHAKIYHKSLIFEDNFYGAYYEQFCLIISLIGLFIRIYTVGHTPANTSGRNTTNQVADYLNVTGIYSIVRNPLYLGNFMMWLGVAFLTLNMWFIIVFCLAYWIYYERIIFSEEQFLIRKFGKSYTDWADKTPAFFPKFSKFIKPSIPFSWKKVLKKEKNGFLALFLVFSGFNIIGEIINKQNQYNYYFITVCIISIILYCVLKFLKKKTHVLNEINR